MSLPLLFAQHGGEVAAQQYLLKRGNVLRGGRFKRRTGVFIKDNQVQFAALIR